LTPNPGIASGGSPTYGLHSKRIVVMTPTLILLLALNDPAPAFPADPPSPPAPAAAPVVPDPPPAVGQPAPFERDPALPLPPADTPPPPSLGIEVDSVLLTLIEQREVPALEAGVLAELHALEGRLVMPDEELARIDATDVRIAEKRAEVELSIARERADNELDVLIAGKSLELATDSLQRAEAARDLVERAVTESDLRQKRLARDVAALEVDKAGRERSLERLNVRLKEAELEAAQRAIERRRIVAPIGGKVVQIHRRRGDWVEPGMPVLRILRIDELRAEAFLDADAATPDLEGRDVTVVASVGDNSRAEFAGVVVFVSPEINEVSGQVRVWVDVKNPKLELRPGQRVRMTIHDSEAAGTARRE
jgi:multidrug efflux pump subunit AcrA (membrane-fusion protein)